MYVNNTPFSSRNLHVDSKYAIRSGNVYRFDLEHVIERPAGTKMIVSVKETKVTNLFDNIKTGVNDILEINGTISGLTTYTIPQNNYNVKSFSDYILNVSGIVVTYTNDFKLIFSSPTEDFTITTNTTLDCIGYEGTSVTSNLGVLTMPYVMNFSSVDYIYIKSNLILRNINHYGATSDTLERLAINMPYGYDVYFNPPNPTQHLSQSNIISYLEIRITDKEGRPLSLKLQNFQVSLEVSFIYPEETKYTKELDRIHPLLLDKENKK